MLPKLALREGYNVITVGIHSEIEGERDIPHDKIYLHSRVFEIFANQ